jgi:hypothetical protein
LSDISAPHCDWKTATGKEIYLLAVKMLGGRKRCTGQPLATCAHHLLEYSGALRSQNDEKLSGPEGRMAKQVTQSATEFEIAAPAQFFCDLEFDSRRNRASGHL